jgi:hypothetical protein
MTGHARIKRTIWRDDEFRTLSVEAQWAYQRLLSDPNCGQAGVLALTRKRWVSSASGMTFERLDAALDELQEAGFIVLDWDYEEVLIRTYIRNNDIASQPNILKAALRQAARVESPLLRAALAVELRLLPPKPEDTARMSYGDPHAVAEEIDPGPGGARLSVVREVPAQPDVSAGGERYSKGSANPSSNPSGNPREKGIGNEVVKRGVQGGESIMVPETTPPRPDVEALCDRLIQKLILNDYKPLPKVTSQWRIQARLILDKDERQLDQAMRLIDWALENEFWSTNIASMGKFRVQYPKLLAAAQREHAGRQARTRSVKDERVAATLELGRRMAAQEALGEGPTWGLPRPDRRSIQA